MKTCEQKIKDGLMGTRQAAEYFHVSQRVLRGWLKSGELRSLKIGGVVRITPQAICDFISDHEKNRDRAMDAELTA
jgi:excisionase family DNA binding protein